MQVALVELGRSAALPHRLADPAHGGAGVGGDELGPHRDDPRRVRPDIEHVEEHDLVGVGAEGLAQQRDVLGQLGDQDRLTATDALLDERRDELPQAVRPVVERGCVPESLGHRCPPVSCQTPTDSLDPSERGSKGFSALVQPRTRTTLVLAALSCSACFFSSHSGHSPSSSG